MGRVPEKHAKPTTEADGKEPAAGAESTTQGIAASSGKCTWI